MPSASHRPHGLDHVAARLGILLALALGLQTLHLERLEVPAQEGPAQEGPATGGLRPAAGGFDWERASPRELRSLPGIGRTRALAVARERWRRDGRFTVPEWTSIAGIGDRTVERVVRTIAGR